jgi:CheY-like chemotaxis protein
MNMDIVVVDDDAVILYLHKILIQKSPLASNIIEFEDASEALNFLNSRTSSAPILILLDINMPGINGWEFLEQLEEDSKENIFVVMVTSSINQSDRSKAAQYPEVIGYLEKPLSVEACTQLHQQLEELTHKQ